MSLILLGRRGSTLSPRRIFQWSILGGSSVGLINLFLLDARTRESDCLMAIAPCFVALDIDTDLFETNCGAPPVRLLAGSSVVSVPAALVLEETLLSLMTCNGN